jgi:para-nitrobenzyl esterase
MRVAPERRPLSSALAALMLPPLVSAQSPIKTDAGLVSGAKRSVAGVRQYLGIPYAAPPVGPNRWRAPQPTPKLDGVKAATEFGLPCIQPKVFGDIDFGERISEDCLYVNVWTKRDVGRREAAGDGVDPWRRLRPGAGSEPRQDGSRSRLEGRRRRQLQLSPRA